MPTSPATVPLLRWSRRTFLKTMAFAAVESGLTAVRPSPAAAQVHPVQLKVEYLRDPLGIDVRRPRLGWTLEAHQRGAKQQAYQIVAAGSRDQLLAGQAALWNSGKVRSENCVAVAYAGQALRSREPVYWRVRTWDSNDRASAWSTPASWEMGLLESSDWRAKWIGHLAKTDRDSTHTGPAPFFRREFDLAGPVTSARAYLCGLGFSELYLNGQRVGDQVLSPNQTDYDSRNLRHLLYPFRDNSRKRMLYVTYDVTRYLRTGRNVVGVILGNGWYNQRDRRVEGDLWYDSPRLIFQLETRTGDGSRVTVVSDKTWKVTTEGPITHNGIFTGEDYDARRELNRWLEPDFDASRWTTAAEVRPPTGLLEAQLSVPDRIVATVQPVKVTRAQSGHCRFDLGQNLAGWARLKVRGPRGSLVALRFIEEMGPDYGQTDHYVLKGGEEEVYEPRFTWHGFREVELTGPPETLATASLEGRVVHSDVSPAGTFECSNLRFNRILHNALWSQLSNMHCGVPSDCPHRERLGYTGDGQVDAEAAMLNFNMAPFYTKWLRDIRDAQNADTGFVPHTVPFEGGGGGPPWGCACVIIPWLMYRYYADRRLLAEHYASMRRWVEYLRRSTDESGLVVREEPGSWCLGEWAAPTAVHIPKPLVNTCYYAYVAQLMIRIAGVLGRPTDARHFAALAHSAQDALNRKYLNAALGQYHDGRQGANVFPLAFGLVPPAHVPAVFNRLVELIHQEDKNHFDTGMYGTPLTLEVLTAGGRADLAYTLMNQTTFPSYGYELSRGATTLWEDWNGHGSHNHAMYASVVRWFYKALAGIMSDDAQPGFKHVLIRPHLVHDLTYAQAEYQSIRGKIVSRWHRKSDSVQLNLEIPAASHATVFLPVTSPKGVRESGAAVTEARGVKLLGVQDGRVACAVQSGRYQFELP